MDTEEVDNWQGSRQVDREEEKETKEFQLHKSELDNKQ